MLPVTHGEAYTRLHIALHHPAGDRLSLALCYYHVWADLPGRCLGLRSRLPVLGGCATAQQQRKSAHGDFSLLHRLSGGIVFAHAVDHYLFLGISLEALIQMTPYRPDP